MPLLALGLSFSFVSCADEDAGQGGQTSGDGGSTHSPDDGGGTHNPDGGGTHNPDGGSTDGGQPAAFELEISPDSIELPEGQSTHLWVKLSADPTVDVSVKVSAPAALRVEPSELVFKAGSFAEEQSIQLTALEDDNKENETVVVELSSGTNKAIANVTIKDNDVQGIFVSAAPKLEMFKGEYRIITVGLNQAPDADVELNITSEPELDNAKMTLTPTNFRQPLKLHFPKARTETEFQLIFKAKDLPDVTLPIALQDQDTLSFTLDKTSIPVKEGSYETVAVKLNKRPFGLVTVDVTADNSKVLLHAPEHVWFRPESGTAAKTVYVVPRQDRDVKDDTRTLSFQFKGAAEKQDVEVKVEDDDELELRVERQRIYKTTDTKIQSIEVTGGRLTNIRLKLPFTPDDDDMVLVDIKLSDEIKDIIEIRNNKQPVLHNSNKFLDDFHLQIKDDAAGEPVAGSVTFSDRATPPRFPSKTIPVEIVKTEVGANSDGSDRHISTEENWLDVDQVTETRFEVSLRVPKGSRPTDLQYPVQVTVNSVNVVVRPQNLLLTSATDKKTFEIIPDDYRSQWVPEILEQNPAKIMVHAKYPNPEIKPVTWELFLTPPFERDDERFDTGLLTRDFVSVLNSHAITVASSEDPLVTIEPLLVGDYDRFRGTHAGLKYTIHPELYSSTSPNKVKVKLRSNNYNNSSRYIETEVDVPLHLDAQGMIAQPLDNSCGWMLTLKERESRKCTLTRRGDTSKAITYDVRHSPGGSEAPQTVGIDLQQIVFAKDQKAQDINVSSLGFASNLGGQYSGGLKFRIRFVNDDPNSPDFIVFTEPPQEMPLKVEPSVVAFTNDRDPVTVKVTPQDPKHILAVMPSIEGSGAELSFPKPTYDLVSERTPLEITITPQDVKADSTMKITLRGPRIPDTVIPVTIHPKAP